MLGLGMTELVIASVILLSMAVGLGLIIFVAMKLAGGGNANNDARRIAELERQVADLQRNQNQSADN